MSKKHKPGALDEFLERQDLAQNPANFYGGNYRSSVPISVGKDPFLRLLFGVIFGIMAAGLLIFMLGYQKDNWFLLIFVAIFTVLSVLNIVDGIRILLAKKK
jgi:hypothetical protein